MQPLIRLNKFLALAQGISRRQADNLIAEGHIEVNGKTAVLGQRITETDTLSVKGQPLAIAQQEYIYLLLNKPVGYVCSRAQQGDTPTIYSLLPEKYHPLKTVGRLDKDSSGLIMLTNDGDFAHQMTHPKFHKVKVYEIELNADLAPLHHQMINDHGIQLEDGPSQLMLERLKEGNNRKWRVTMSEGRNRQIRRTFASLGYEVVKLHRTMFGPYSVDNLKDGQFESTTI